MRYIASVLLLFICIQFAAAQETYSSSGGKKIQTRKQAAGFDPNKLIIGGGLGLSAGSGVTYFAVSPLVGYRLTEDLSAGVEFGYQYYRNKNDAVIISTGSGTYIEPFDRKSNIYTTGVWGRYIVWRNLFFQAKFQMLNVDDYQNFRYDQYSRLVADDRRQWVPALIPGLGLRQPVSERSSLVLYIGYDVLQNPNSPYYHTLDMGVIFNAGF